MRIALGEGRGDRAAAVLAVLWAGGVIKAQGGCGGVLRLDSDGVTDGVVVGIHQGWSYVRCNRRLVAVYTALHLFRATDLA